MKDLLLIAFLISFMTSCGPHRMSCGARGICNASEKEILKKHKAIHNTQFVKIQADKT